MSTFITRDPPKTTRRMQAIADRLTGFDRPDDADPRVTAAERMAAAAREED